MCVCVFLSNLIFSYCMVFWSGYDGETVSDVAFVLQAVVIGASKLLAAFTGQDFSEAEP